jgi:hypothetical protein
VVPDTVFTYKRPDSFSEVKGSNASNAYVLVLEWLLLLVFQHHELNQRRFQPRSSLRVEETGVRDCIWSAVFSQIFHQRSSIVTLPPSCSAERNTTLDCPGFPLAPSRSGYTNVRANCGRAEGLLVSQDDHGVSIQMCPL